VDLRRDGKSFNQIISMVKEKRDKTHVFLVLDDLKYIVKGGRLPAKIKTIADLFRLRPVIGTKNEGQLKARGVLWGRSNMESKFANFLGSKINNNFNYRIMIAHANSLKKGNRLLELLLKKHTNIKEHYLVELGGALGAHSGPQALSIGIQEIN
jgi:DegV family protein with EDD domain